MEESDGRRIHEQHYGPGHFKVFEEYHLGPRRVSFPASAAVSRGTRGPNPAGCPLARPLAPRPTQGVLSGLRSGLPRNEGTLRLEAAISQDYTGAWPCTTATPEPVPRLCEGMPTTASPKWRLGPRRVSASVALGPRRVSSPASRPTQGVLSVVLQNITWGPWHGITR